MTPTKGFRLLLTTFSKKILYLSQTDVTSIRVTSTTATAIYQILTNSSLNITIETYITKIGISNYFPLIPISNPLDERISTKEKKSWFS